LPSFTPRIPPTPTSTLFPYTTLFRSHNTTVGKKLSQPLDSPADALLRRFIACAENCRHLAGRLAFEISQGQGIVVRPAQFAERRSEEHTSELQSPYDLVCRLLLEKKK